MVLSLCWGTLRGTVCNSDRSGSKIRKSGKVSKDFNHVY